MIHLPNPVNQVKGIYKREQKLVNLITEFYSMPCVGNGLIYFEAAALGIWDFIWAIESPDVRHSITKGTGRSALCHLKSGINATGIGRSGPGFPVKSALYNMAAKVDISTWWGFLISSAEDGLIDFFSSAIRMSGCAKMRKGGEWGYGDHCVAGGPHNANWNGGPVWRAADWPTTPQVPNSWALGPGESASISGSYEVWNTTAIIPLAFSTRIYNETTGEQHVFRDPDGNGIEGYHTAFFKTIRNPNPFTCVYDLQTYVDPGQPYLSWISNGIGHGFFTKNPAGWVDRGSNNPGDYKSKFTKHDL